MAAIFLTGQRVAVAGIEASAWSLVLMVAGLPLYWWARRERAVNEAPERYSAG